MPVLIPPPLFADAGAVVGLLVLIFTVVGWLVNLANSQNNPAAPPPQNRPRPPRPKADRVQNEIDVFLQEVRGQNVPKEDVVLEALPPERPGGRPRPVAPAPPPQPETAPPTGRNRLATVASSVESHVGETLASHHLATNVGDKPPVAHLPTAQTGGEMVALQPLGRPAAGARLPVISLFKERQTIRQAVLVNEILSKPKALRES
jgi:hypothetical protein